MYRPKDRVLSIALVAVLGAAIVSAAAVQAQEEPALQPPPGMAEGFIKQHDTDGDGRISQAEALAPEEARFKDLDADSDGFVTADEFRQSFEARVPAEVREQMQARGLGDPSEGFIKELDKNGDGKVELAEAVQPGVEGFKRMDTDGDGFATQPEAEAFFREMWEAMSRMHQQAEPPAQ